MLEIILSVLLMLNIAFISALIARKKGKIWIIGTFVGFVIIANILASKIIVFFKWAVPAGIIAYSATFLLTDILSEFYSKKSAKQAVWIGFFTSVILVISIWLAIKWPSAIFWQNQTAFETILGNTWRIVLASMIAYLISQNHDIWSYHFWKKKTKGRFLWFRNNFSTIVSQFIDSVIFITIAFYGLFPLLPMIIGQFIFKILIAVIDTPFLYLTRYFYRR